MTLRRTPSLVSSLILVLLAIVWILPIAVTVYVSFRPYLETQQGGYLSLPVRLSFDNSLRPI